MLRILGVALAACGMTRAAEGPPCRVPLPPDLPPHPRVLCTQADIDRIRADLARGDAYTTACVAALSARAESILSAAGAADTAPLTPARLAEAAALAQAFAVTRDDRFGVAARDILVAAAPDYRTLKTTRAAGRLTDSTLREGPVAVNAAVAYDLIAAEAFFPESARQPVRDDLLRVMGRECGTGCRHANSSNWRSWGLCISAVCGFAAGDRDLIEASVNGVYDQRRQVYLYGAVQQLTHSIFADGIHWERSMGYTYYTASALLYVLVAAKNSGIDLWQAQLPGLEGPFPGSAPHEEYTPGPRSFRTFLEAPFYYAFPGGAFAEIGDSGSRALAYHPIYEIAWREYRDPRFAALIRAERQARADADVPGWQVWKPAGNPGAEMTETDGSLGVRLETRSPADRIALVRTVYAPQRSTVTVSGSIRVLQSANAQAHIRVNIGPAAYYTERVSEAGPARTVAVSIPAPADAAPAGQRALRIHAFLEGGPGEAVWQDIRVTGEDGTELLSDGGFDSAPVGGRGMTFFDLVHAEPELPDAEFSLGPDVDIGTVGRHRNGCTLFPVGGFAILRSHPTDPNAAAVSLSYGPYGSGHDHPDRLTIDVFGRGRILCPDAGSWGYDNPMHLTWANQTVAHNTLVADEISQEPQGKSDSIWAAERGDARVTGKLRVFYPGPDLKVVRATCDSAYPGVTLDRTLCLTSGAIADVFRVTSDRPRTLDLPLHGLGTAKLPDRAPNTPREGFTARGYAHLADVRDVTPDSPVLVLDFETDDAKTRVIRAVGPEDRVFLATDPARGEPRTVLLSRKHGAQAAFATVIEPHAGEPTVVRADIRHTDTEVSIVLSFRDGHQEELVIPADPGAPVSRTVKPRPGEPPEPRAVVPPGAIHGE